MHHTGSIKDPVNAVLHRETCSDEITMVTHVLFRFTFSLLNL